MFRNLDDTLGAATNPFVAPTVKSPTSTSSSTGSGWNFAGGVIGSAFGAGATILSSFISSEANKEIAKQQGKTEMFSVMAQQKVALEGQKSQVEMERISQEAETERTGIRTQALAWGAVAVTVIGLAAAAAYVAKD